MKFEMLITSVVLLLSGSAFAAPHCPNLEGAYWIDVHSISKVGKINAAELKPGGCQVIGDGITPDMVPSESFSGSDLKSLPKYYPLGIRIYVYASTPDYCNYLSFAYLPVVDASNEMDRISYEDFRRKVVDKSVYSGPYTYRRVSSDGFERTADGSYLKVEPEYDNVPSGDNGTYGLGIYVWESHHASTEIRSNGDILVSTSSRVKGVKFYTIPVYETDAMVCLLKRL